MAQRDVTGVAKDKKKRVAAIGNPGEGWSPVSTEEAIVHIRQKLHTYYSTSPAGESRRLTVVSRGDREFLRSVSDPRRGNNLSALPLLGASNPLTGGFDVVVDVDESTMQTALRAAHAAGVLDRVVTRVFKGNLVVINLSFPKVEPILGGGNGAVRGSEADLTTTLHCWVRPLDDLADPGWSATARLATRAHLVLRPPWEEHGSWALLLTYTRRPRNDVVVFGATGDRRTFVINAIDDYVRNGRPDAWSVMIDGTVGAPSDLDFRFATGAAAGSTRVQVGASFGRPVGGGFSVSRSAAAWQVALGRRYIADKVYTALVESLGAAPPPAGLRPVSLGDGVSLDALEVSLAPNGLELSGQLSRSGPTVTASFSVPVAVSLAANSRVKVDVGTPTVTVNEWYAKIADFFSGSGITRGIQEGLRSALAGQGGGQLAGFFSTQLLQDLLSFGTTAKIKVTPRVTLIEPGLDALVVSGSIDAPTWPKPVAAMQVQLHPGRLVLLDASGSWAPGGSIRSVRWDFGDGATSDLSGNDVAFIVGHRYVGNGPYKATVSVTGDDTRTASASVSIRPRT